jgi:hypothetical protein
LLNRYLLGNPRGVQSRADGAMTHSCPQDSIPPVDRHCPRQTAAVRYS